MTPQFIAALAAFAFLIALVATRGLVGVLGRKGLLDRPNDRSSHSVPTPRGGGFGILAGVVPAWVAISLATGAGQGFGGIGLMVGLALLVLVSWRDDRGGLPWLPRLLAQGVAVLLGLLPFALLPVYATEWGECAFLIGTGAAAAFLWLSFINAFNFMDGIDGLAGSEAVTAAGGAAIAFAMLGTHPALTAAALTLAAASAGFLVWNRPPARIFMGDVGSIPLGFLLGFLLVALAAEGAWGAALTLPAYFGADTLLTVWRRRRRGARLTEAHREHAYQHAAGLTTAGHARVVKRVALSNLGLVLAVVLGLLVGGPAGQWLTLGLGALIVLELLLALERMAKHAGGGP